MTVAECPQAVRSAAGDRPLPRATRRLVAVLAAATLLQWTGASAVLPWLPIFLRRHGSGDALVGAVMAAFFAAGVLAQYLAGRVGDRFGHRPVLVAGLLGYGLASAGFLIPLSGVGYLVLRAAQGAAAGSAQVASLALVSRTVPRERRGRAFATVYGAELAGVAIGPLLGSAVGVSRMGWLFLTAATLASLACLPVLLARVPPAAAVPAVVLAVVPAARVSSGAATMPGVPGPGTPAGPEPDRDPQPVRGVDGRGIRRRIMIGVLIAAVTGGLLTGVYEACWTLLLDLRGATTWQLGASWTMFALPFVVMAPVSGWLTDHWDRRWLVVLATVSSFGFAVLYPFVTDLSWLIGLGALESVGVALAVPAAQSLLADGTPAEASGAAQGTFAGVQTAAVAVSAGLSGGLFGIAAWLPFVVVAVVSAVLTVLLAVIWRPVPGRVRTPVAPDAPIRAELPR